jgi:hypothetical protein
MSLYAEDDSAEARWHDSEPDDEREPECGCGAPAVTVICDVIPACRACAEEHYEQHPALRPSVLRANVRGEE